MDSSPKASAWKLIAPNIKVSRPDGSNHSGSKLSLEVWPELPNGSDTKQHSSKLAPHKKGPVGYSTPERTTKKSEGSSPEGSPTPRAKRSDLTAQHPRSGNAFLHVNDERDLFSPASTTSKPPSFKSSTTLVSSNRKRATSKMEPLPYEFAVPSRFYNIASFQAAAKDDPVATLNYIKSILNENDYLKKRLSATNRDLENANNHIKTTIETYKSLEMIAKSKECLLHEQIAREKALNKSSSHTSTTSEPITCIEVGAEESSSLPRFHNGNIPKLDPSAVRPLSKPMHPKAIAN